MGMQVAPGGGGEVDEPRARKLEKELRRMAGKDPRYTKEGIRIAARIPIDQRQLAENIHSLDFPIDALELEARLNVASIASIPNTQISDRSRAELMQSAARGEATYAYPPREHLEPGNIEGVQWNVWYRDTRIAIQEFEQQTGRIVSSEAAVPGLSSGVVPSTSPQLRSYNPGAVFNYKGSSLPVTQDTRQEEAELRRQAQDLRGHVTRVPWWARLFGGGRNAGRARASHTPDSAMQPATQEYLDRQEWYKQQRLNSPEHQAYLARPPIQDTRETTSQAQRQSMLTMLDEAHEQTTADYLAYHEYRMADLDYDLAAVNADPDVQELAAESARISSLYKQAIEDDERLTAQENNGVDTRREHAAFMQRYRIAGGPDMPPPQTPQPRAQVIRDPNRGTYVKSGHRRLRYRDYQELRRRGILPREFGG